MGIEESSAAGAREERSAETELSLSRILLSILLALLVCFGAIYQPAHPRPEEEQSLLERFFYPMERNAGLRLPSLPTSIQAIRFAEDGERGWAAGGGGTILRTLDGGKSWTTVPTGTAATLYGLYFDAEGQRGWAVGDRGALLRTVDGGVSWELQRSTDGQRLRSITFSDDGQVGWIAGGHSLLLKSVDGGESWFPQTGSEMGATTSLALNWTSGRALVLTRRLEAATGLETPVGGTDAGSLERSGAPAGSPGTGALGGSPGAGAVGGTEVGSGGGGSGTEMGGGGGLGSGNTDFGGLGSGNLNDGGKVNLPSETDEGRVILPQRSATSKRPRELYFDPGGRRFWAFGAAGVLSVSDDDGARWRTRVLDPAVDIEDLWFAGEGRLGWAVGSGGAILATEDGGLTWSRRVSGTSADLAAIYATAGGEKVWASGADGTLLASTDSGKSWRALTSGVESVLKDVEISADGSRAWAVGGRGLILSSDDGGATWEHRDSGTTERLNAVAFDEAGKIGVAVGNNGTILASDDRGANWAAVVSEGGSRFTDVHMSPDGGRARVVGPSGLLYGQSGGSGWTLGIDATLDAVEPVRIAGDGDRLLVLGQAGTAASLDGGRTWRLEPSSGASGPFNAADLIRDGRSLIVGEGGSMAFALAPTGTKWGVPDSDTDATLHSVDFTASGRAAWAAGEGGTLLLAEEDGFTWAPRDSGTGSARLSVRFSDDGAVGLTAGHAPSLLRTVNQGSSWSAVSLPLHYGRYPAPWFWPALLLAGAPLFLSLRRPKTGADDVEGAAAIGASDKPTGDFAHDRLQFGPLAMGISRFLRNSRTEPPLTVAISGSWGSGKSSLMQLVCADLRRHGYRPVWFNAWHHQSDEQLLASLLNAVRAQGLPPLTSLDGWVFRFQLLWLRSKRNYVVALVAVALAAAALAGWFSGDLDAASWGRIGDSLRDLFGNDKTAKGAEAKDAFGPASALGAVAALFAAYRATRAFGVDPAVLLSSSFNSFRLKDASAQTSFRERFAEEFEDVTEALPYRMVIVIDDLDRCQPETVLTVMETVNFLVSAGSCFVLFGMARERVLAGLSLTFHSIAKELTELDVTLAEDAGEAGRERAEREARARYASDYLEKLINIDIKVPAREDIPPHVLLEAPAEPPERPSSKLLRHAWPALLIMAAAALGLAAPEWLAGSKPDPRSTVEQKEQPVVATSTETSTTTAQAEEQTQGPATGQVPDAAPMDSFRPPLQTAEIKAGEEAAAWWYFLVGLVTSGLILAAVFRYRSRQEQREVRDSRAFLGALETWLPVIQQKRPSPRRIKRFGNFIRYLAMLQQGDPPDEPAPPPLLSRFRFPFGRPRGVTTAAVPPAFKTVVEEHRLVALAALYDAYEGKWRDNLRPQGTEPLDDAVRAAIEHAENEADWPPSPAELASFEEAIKGIRLAGAAEVVRAGRHRPPKRKSSRINLEKVGASSASRTSRVGETGTSSDGVESAR